MQSTLYGETKRHYEKRVSRVFLSFLATKITVYMEKQNITKKRVF